MRSTEIILGFGASVEEKTARLPTAVAAKSGSVPTHERLGPDDCENLQDDWKPAIQLTQGSRVERDTRSAPRESTASSVVRLRFVARLLDEEVMTDVRRHFGISGKTSYKIFDHYKAHGFEALSDRSKWLVRYANRCAPRSRP